MMIMRKMIARKIITRKIIMRRRISKVKRIINGKSADLEFLLLMYSNWVTM